MMESTKLENYSKKEKVIKAIYQYEPSDTEESGTSFINHAGLPYYDKDEGIFISANQLNDVLEETGYGISPISCYAPRAQPLFDKIGKMYDILLSVFNLDDFICEVSTNDRKYLAVDYENFESI